MATQNRPRGRPINEKTMFKDGKCRFFRLVLMDFDLLASPICHTKVVHSFPPVERLFAEMRQPLFDVPLFLTFSLISLLHYVDGTV